MTPHCTEPWRKATCGALGSIVWRSGHTRLRQESEGRHELRLASSHGQGPDAHVAAHGARLEVTSRCAYVGAEGDEPWGAVGTLTMTRVPRPLTISSEPPTPLARSCMERRPRCPGKLPPGSNPTPSSAISSTTECPSG